MEIIVVDDHSTQDDPAEVVRKLGASRVKFIRQPENIGKVRNYESGLSASRGRLIHQLHGDDRVRPGFYLSMESAFATFPRAGAFFSECRYIDEEGRVTGKTGLEAKETGILHNWIETIVVAQRIQTPSIVLRREVYETLGAFDRRLDAMEDWEMWIRVASRFPVGFIPAALADYRTSPGNATERTLRSGAQGRVVRELMSIISEYLPSDLMERTDDTRRRAIAQSLIQFVPHLIRRRQLRTVARVYADALSFSRHPSTIYRMLRYTASGLSPRPGGPGADA